MTKDEYIRVLEQRIKALQHELEEVYGILDIEVNQLEPDYDEEVSMLLDSLSRRTEEE